MGKTLPPSDRAAILAVIDPDATAAGTVTTGWLKMDQFQSIMAVVMAGALGGGNVNAKLEQATDGSGTGAKDVTGKAITQMATDDRQSIINCFADELDIENDFTHARLSVTVAGATGDIGAIVMGFDPRYLPASQFDAATVAEVIN